MTPVPPLESGEDVEREDEVEDDNDVDGEDDVGREEEVESEEDVGSEDDVESEEGADSGEVVESKDGWLGVKVNGDGLRPPVPSSVAPNGIPSRPTGAAAIPVGEEADPLGRAEPLPAEAHVPDAVPVMPPPSKVMAALDVPPFELPMPKDVSGIEPPKPEQALLVAGPRDDVADVAGLMPGEASSVAPRGIPVGATGKPGPMPSGEVTPRGEGLDVPITPT